MVQPVFDGREAAPSIQSTRGAEQTQARQAAEAAPPPPQEPPPPPAAPAAPVRPEDVGARIDLFA